MAPHLTPFEDCDSIFVSYFFSFKDNCHCRDSLAFVSLRFNPVFNFSFELRPVLFSSSSASFRGSHSLKNGFLLSRLTYALFISFKLSSGRSVSIFFGVFYNLKLFLSSISFSSFRHFIIYVITRYQMLDI